MSREAVGEPRSRKLQRSGYSPGVAPSVRAVSLSWEISFIHVLVLKVQQLLLVITPRAKQGRSAVSRRSGPASGPGMSALDVSVY